MTLKQNTCQHVKPDGKQCRARKVRGSDFCFFHDPSRTAERTAAQKAGGRNGRATVLSLDVPGRTVKTATDVVDLLSETINHVRTGQLDPKIGNCMGYLAGIILKAAEQGGMEERLAALEGIVSAQGRPTSLFDTDPEDLVIDGEDRAEPQRATA